MTMENTQNTREKKGIGALKPEQNMDLETYQKFLLENVEDYPELSQNEDTMNAIHDLENLQGVEFENPEALYAFLVFRFNEFVEQEKIAQREHESTGSGDELGDSVSGKNDTPPPHSYYPVVDQTAYENRQ